MTLALRWRKSDRNSSAFLGRFRFARLGHLLGKTVRMLVHCVLVARDGVAFRERADLALLLLLLLLLLFVDKNPNGFPIPLTKFGQHLVSVATDVEVERRVLHSRQEKIDENAKTRTVNLIEDNQQKLGDYLRWNEVGFGSYSLAKVSDKNHKDGLDGVIVSNLQRNGEGEPRRVERLLVHGQTRKVW